jgi:hypothetical protein
MNIKPLTQKLNFITSIATIIISSIGIWISLNVENIDTIQLLEYIYRLIVLILSIFFLNKGYNRLEKTLDYYNENNA